MPSTKRSRPDADESRAECYYTVRQRAPTAQEVARHQDRKARRDQPLEEDKKAEWHWQSSPFNPTGFTKSSESMDLKYAIDTDPHMAPAQWGDMTRYNSFVLGKEKFYTDDFVFVANEETVKRQKANDGGANGSQLRRADNGWVARILEIRASDEQHVYARVYWMYWPEELPAGTHCGRKTIRGGGRQPYHGQHELIASNHMDVINAVSVTMAAEVNHWIETDEDDTQPALYWRQAYNLNTSQLSPAKEVCRCEMPAHPDKLLIRCSSHECGKWMHEDCLRHDALMRVYERLGKKMPQIFEGEPDVKKEEPPPEGLVSPPATDAEKKEAEDKPSLQLNDIKLPLFVGGSRPSPSPGAGARGRSSTPKKALKKEPYKGLFEAEIRLNDGPTAWQIKDLRSNVDGGSKTWLEQTYCMFCNQSID